MKFSQKVINTIIIALLTIFGYNEYDPILPTAQEEMAFGKQAPTIPAPQVVPQVTDEPIFVEGEAEPKTSWYCWLSYWVPTSEVCGDYSPENCKQYSWYAYPQRIRMIQEKKPTPEDFVFDNGLFLPTWLKETEGIDHDKIEIANVYAIQAWPRNPEQ